MRSRTIVHTGIMLVLTVSLLTAFAGPVAASEECPDETAADCGLDEDPEYDGLYDGPEYNVSNETDIGAFTTWTVSRPGSILSL